jgi:hypothetical protein
MKLFIGTIILAGSVLLIGCDSTNWADVGYDDGYAVGYNTTCKIRATLVEGNWDNSQYMTAYNQGHADGSADCRRSNP